MARITPKTNAAIFTDDILNLLPANKDLKHGVAMQKRSEDPEWQANHKLRNQLKAQDPEWQAKMKLVGKNNSQNPEWRANNKLRGEKLAADPEWRANQKLMGEKNKELYKDPTKCPRFKGPSIGIHMETGEIIMLCGDREIKAAGFHPGNISECINGKRKHYKKYIWSRDEPI